MQKLTETDRIILESYKSVLEGLSAYLGEAYEIVLHSLESFDRSAIKVLNGHYSGRIEGAPITDLAIEMLSKIKNNSNPNEAIVYFNHTKNGRSVRSTTIPINNPNGDVIGLLCINLYLDVKLNDFFDSLFKIDFGEQIMSETFSNDAEDLIRTTVEKVKTKVMADTSISVANKNKEIITVLHGKNIFNLKDAVVKVATLLGISKNTVYMHIRNLTE